MLYSEFLENTGFYANEHNYKVYNNLNEIYMNDDSITKDEIYKIGKKLCKNSHIDDTLIHEAKTEIKESEENIEHYQRRIETFKYYLSLSISKAEEAMYKDHIKYMKELIKRERNWIERQKLFIRICK